MPKEGKSNSVETVINPNAIKEVDFLIEKLEKADAIVQKINSGLIKQQELISKRDCIGREFKIKPIEGTFQHVGNGTYEVKFDAPQVEENPVELENNKWWKSEAGSFIYKVSDTRYYGFINDVCWTEFESNDINWDGKWKAATTEEIAEALKAEAIKRGLVEGVYISRNFSIMKTTVLIDTERFPSLSGYFYDYNDDRNGFMLNGFVIFENGVWAQPIPTVTRKEAEEKLGFKILDFGTKTISVQDAEKIINAKIVD